MTGVITVKSFKKDAKPKCLVSEVDRDNYGDEFVMLLEPLDMFNEPVFRYRKLKDGNYQIEGEGYILTGDIKEKINKHKSNVSKYCKDKSLKWIEIN